MSLLMLLILLIFRFRHYVITFDADCFLFAFLSWRPLLRFFLITPCTLLRHFRLRHWYASHYATLSFASFAMMRFLSPLFSWLLRCRRHADGRKVRREKESAIRQMAAIRHYADSPRCFRQFSLFHCYAFADYDAFADYFRRFFDFSAFRHTMMHDTMLSPAFRWYMIFRYAMRRCRHAYTAMRSTRYTTTVALRYTRYYLLISPLLITPLMPRHYYALLLDTPYAAITLWCCHCCFFMLSPFRWLRFRHISLRQLRYFRRHILMRRCHYAFRDMITFRRFDYAFTYFHWCCAPLFTLFTDDDAAIAAH